MSDQKLHFSPSNDSIAPSLKVPAGPSTEYTEVVAVPDQRYQSDDEDTIAHRSLWSKYRDFAREPLAEFLGTAILVILGTGANCSTALSTSPKVASSPHGGALSGNIGWALGVSLGVWVCGGVSAGHINPAITIAMATFGRFPWKKVPVYIFAQLWGAIFGAAVIYGNYYHAINVFEGGAGVRTLATAGLFGTFAADYMSNANAFFNEFLGTAIFLIVIFAFSDKKNIPPPNGLQPLVLFLVVLGIGIATGLQTGAAINPARDFGPRILTSIVGYGGAVYSFRNQYWLWCGILGPISGALAGSFVYDVLIYTGSDSPINRSAPFRKERRPSDASNSV
ncbi:putative aquaporin 4 [Pluteus cervinus]|uniref:Aquaporin 4 n=1 Tax=Pluteus cervinus TaxID=181527 RepID=A0ACD3B743_9AGAR|nr:putative aquaporin 4 [Pluteus cervinus]